MSRYAMVMMAFLVMDQDCVSAPPPLRVTIDCGSSNTGSRHSGKSIDISSSRFDPTSFCSFIHRAIPKAVHDGKFVQIEEPDQTGYSNDEVPFFVAPPKGFIPKLGPTRFKGPKVKVPKFTVPKLRVSHRGLKAPRVESSMPFPSFRNFAAEESSAERMERFKKGVQKMLHVVKVLGQIDQYLSERTRIIVEKLSKTLAE